MPRACSFPGPEFPNWWANRQRQSTPRELARLRDNGLRLTATSQFPVRLQPYCPARWLRLREIFARVRQPHATSNADTLENRDLRTVSRLSYCLQSISSWHAHLG